MKGGRTTSRRAAAAVLFGALSLAPAALAQDASGEAAAGVRFRSIVVDASRLAERGSPRIAAAVERQLTREASEVFADRLTPSDTHAPHLVIRVDSIRLSSYVGGSPLSLGDTSNTDFLEGAGIVEAGERVLSTTPTLSALDASYSGAWTVPDIDERRVGSITHHFAYWLRREMGL